MKGLTPAGPLRPGGLAGTARCAALPGGPPCGLAASLAPRGARRYPTAPLRPGGLTGTARCAALPDGPPAAGGLIGTRAVRGAT